jgi:hypothetical protein
MKPGDIKDWLDQGPALLLKECQIPRPCTEENLGDFLADTELWPSDIGWKIKLLLTGETLDVHIDTLDDGFIYKPEGIH